MFNNNKQMNSEDILKQLGFNSSSIELLIPFLEEFNLKLIKNNDDTLLKLEVNDYSQTIKFNLTDPFHVRQRGIFEFFRDRCLQLLSIQDGTLALERKEILPNSCQENLIHNNFQQECSSRKTNLVELSICDTNKNLLFWYLYKENNMLKKQVETLASEIKIIKSKI